MVIKNNIALPELDFIIITVATETDFGQFIFPKSILAAQGIIAVYPPWDMVMNKQAVQTQKWQGEYFLTIDLNKPLNLDRARALLAPI